LSAVLVGIFGYIQKGMGLIKPLFTNGTDRSDFFAFFPYDGHWAAFAILWSCACIAMALLSTRYDDSDAFIHSTGPWYLTGGILLGATGFLVQSPVPAAALLLTFSIMLLIVTFEFSSNSHDTHRKAIATSSALAGCLCFAGGIYRIFQDSAWNTDASALRNAAYAMFQANPIFGWGFDSYSQLLPFFGSDSLLGQRSERASSDLLQLLAEFGIFGSLLLLGTLIAFIVRYIRGEHHIRLTNHLLIACSGVLLLSVFDTPFMSPAVVFSFLVIFFSALRWAEISRNKIDEVDAARPQLVTPASQRRVPFFNKQYKEKEK
jgi:ABC-type multidrug transport system fused ATPase/permease subunit